MPFRKFTPARRQDTWLPQLSLTIPAHSGQRYAPFLLLADDLIARLGWQGGMKLSLEMGDGRDYGQIRISPSTEGNVALEPAKKTGKRKRARIYIGRMPCLADEPSKSDPQFTISEHTLLLTIPTYARARQLATQS